MKRAISRVKETSRRRSIPEPACNSVNAARLPIETEFARQPTERSLDGAKRDRNDAAGAREIH
jgi:hypothetical protein